ncbi:MAG: M23 family metallopeptidase [Pseudomonadota bacterium]
MSGTQTVDAIDKPFGFRVLCPTCTKLSDADFHRGIDIDAPIGTPIHAIWHGRVDRIRRSASVSKRPRFGKFLVIALDPIIRTDSIRLKNHKVTYLHRHTIETGLSEGTLVEPGTRLGTVGKSGRAIRTVHLHFE